MKYTLFLVLFIFINLSCSIKNRSLNSTKTKDQTNTQEPTPDIVDDIVIDRTDFKFHFKNSNFLSKVLDIAAKENKLVFLDINASWCTPCKLMQRDVYTNEEVASLFNENFINYMVDVDSNEGPDLKLIYDIQAIPTLLFLDAKGRVILKKEGAAYPIELTKLANQALSLVR